MTKPAVWNDDPECGHEVAYAYQTHYCAYIRVPRLLTLQQPESSDELLLITAHQWHELWFKVLLADLRAALADPSVSFAPAPAPTYEPVKLLKRGVELFKLFDQHADLAETVIVRELGLTRALPAAAVSDQFAQIGKLAQQLERLEAMAYPGLAEAVREYRARFESFCGRHQKFVAATLKAPPPRAEAGPGSGPVYEGWLRLPELLDLQQGVKSAWAEKGQPPTAFWQPERISADENMFIIVHQCFEIWFKVLLDLIDRAIPALLNEAVAEATRLMRRAVLIQRLLVTQIQIPATMLPLDFLKFREQTKERDGKVLRTGLTPASGTESYQFREIEIACGLRDDPVFQKYLAGTDKLPIRLLTPRQRERLEEPTLPEAFRRAVQQRGLLSFDVLFTPADAPNPHADLAQLADTLIEFDEFFRFWRLGHVS
ncbi:MAG: tryptophan 2,3-dioxygenase family protein, partial [Anaerolineales bacterium]